MAEVPDVRALRHLLSAGANGRRPVRCLGCPFARPYLVAGGRVTCDLLGDGTVIEPDRPQCTSGHWRERARVELDLLECDNALLAAVASDAREESSTYRRGLAEGAAAGREACRKAVCGRCAAGAPVSLQGGVWCHPSLTHGPALVGPCKADAIRRRAEEDGR